MSRVPWTDGQARALEAFESFLDDSAVAVFLLRGPAGTGKSELISEFASIARTTGRSVRVMAPTGQAARRLAARIGRSVTTVHSAIYIRRGNSENGEDVPPTAEFVLDPDCVLGQMTIVDEASLVGDTVTGPIDRMPEVRYGSGRLLSDLLENSLSLGGRVVFVGDPQQLPAFGEESAICLDQATFEERGVGVVARDLDEIVRQKDGSNIASLGAALRRECERESKAFPVLPEEGDLRRLVLPASTEILDAVAGDNGVVLAWRNVDVGRWNARIRQHRGASDSMPIPGDRLIALQAVPAAGLMNGDELTVTAVHERENVRIRDDEITLVGCDIVSDTGEGPRTQSVRVVMDLLEAPDRARLQMVTRLLWVDFVLRMRSAGIDRRNEAALFWERAEVDSRWTALRATYAYARTVYRAQGGEWPDVIFDATGVRAARNGLRLSYTAVTRATDRLYVRNWPRISFDRSNVIPTMCEEISRIVTELTTRPVSVAPLDASPQTIQIKDFEDGEMSLNVYTRKGEPSKVHVQRGGDLPWVDALRQEIETWIFEWHVENHPCPDEVTEWLHTPIDRLTIDGIDVRVWNVSDYVVGVELVSGVRRHVGRYHHDATGRLTKRLDQAGKQVDSFDGDLQDSFESGVGFEGGAGERDGG